MNDDGIGKKKWKTIIGSPVGEIYAIEIRLYSIEPETTTQI